MNTERLSKMVKDMSASGPVGRLKLSPVDYQKLREEIGSDNHPLVFQGVVLDLDPKLDSGTLQVE
jgi:hypothetical protein